MEEGWKKPPPPNHVNTGSHFAINFFRLARATPKHGGPADQQSHGEKVLDTLSKKGSQEAAGHVAAIFYAYGTRGREFSLSTLKRAEGGRGNARKKIE